MLTVIALFAALLLPAWTEEIGWMGFLFDRMQRGRTALGAAVLLGSMWALWHVVPLIQAHRAATWIAWHAFETVATRMLIVWVYSNTGRSVFAAVLFHAIDNVSWLMFPNAGSHYDPRVTAPITLVAAALVTVVWGPVAARCGNLGSNGAEP